MASTANAGGRRLSVARSAVLVGLAAIAILATSAPVIASTRAVPPTPAATAAPSFGYVTGEHNRVRTFNTATGRFKARIALPASVALSASNELAITPDGATVWVTAEGDATHAGAIVPITAATNAVGTPVLVGPDPQTIAITPDGATAYVGHDVASGGLTPVDLESATAGPTIALDGGRVTGATPVSVTITPDGKTVFAGVVTPSGNYVVPVATATNAAQTPIGPLTVDPRSCAITPSGRTLYCVDGGSGAGGVLPIDAQTGSVGTMISLASSTSSLAISPTGTLLYALAPGPGTIDPVTLPAGSPQTPLTDPETVSSLPQASVFTPKGSTAWLALGSGVQKITVSTGAIGVEVAVPKGGSAYALAIPADQGPIAAFTATPAPDGSPTSFDASASTAGSTPITKYAWNFGDGGTAATSGPTTSHTYATSGTYAASLTVTDRAGTSTRVVFTGQTVSRNGSPAAHIEQSVAVPASLQSIDVTPADVSIQQGATKQYAATGNYSDGSTADLTTEVTWSSSSTNVSVSNTSGSQGLATASNTPGATTIFATDGTVSGSTTLTVTCRSHQNGLGGTYSDCAPLGTPGTPSTYNSTMANEAAMSWSSTGTISSAQCGSGLNTASVVIDQAGVSGPTATWVYAASGNLVATVGHVFRSANATAFCPVATDPAWN